MTFDSCADRHGTHGEKPDVENDSRSQIAEFLLSQRCRIQITFRCRASDSRRVLSAESDISIRIIVSWCRPIYWDIILAVCRPCFAPEVTRTIIF